ncbi:MAG: MmcQ/YjbR family DNA-binding protein [Flavobacteriales bacterium]|nr:MmcQ/YjbR family DNA-binding protein [Flavobacteriales bacterium]
MNIEEYRAYCLSKPGTSEGMPFDDEVLVFKVGGKMFALTRISSFEYINLKCDPERALELRASHDAIRPGYHMSKTHWNSVYLHQGLEDGLVRELIDHSYSLVYASLSKKVRTSISNTPQ